MFLWLTVPLKTLGNSALGAVARDAILAPQTWISWQAVCTSGYFWLIHVELGESLLFLAFQAELPNSSELVPKFEESRLLNKGVCRPLTVAWGDKGREGGPGEGGVGIQWLPRPEQKSSEFFCIHSDAQQFPALFLQSACSTCFYLTISCLQLPKTGEITICHKISLYGPFWAGFTHLFFLSSVHRSFRLRHCVLCVHVYMHV